MLSNFFYYLFLKQCIHSIVYLRVISDSLPPPLLKHHCELVGLMQLLMCFNAVIILLMFKLSIFVQWELLNCLLGFLYVPVIFNSFLTSQYVNVI